MDAVDTEKQAGGGGVTFAVEPGIKAAGPGSYGADRRAYCEPSTGDSMAAAWGKLGHVEAMSPAPTGTVATFTPNSNSLS